MRIAPPAGLPCAHDDDPGEEPTKGGIWDILADVQAHWTQNLPG